MQIQLHPDAKVTKEGENVVKVTSPHVTLTLDQVPDEIQRLLLALTEFQEESQLLAEFSSLDPCLGASIFYYYLGLLEEHNFLVYKTAFIQAIGTHPNELRVGKIPQGPFQIGRYVVCRRENEDWIAESPLASVKCILHAAEGVELFFTLAKAHTIEDLCKRFPQFSKEALKETVALLWANKMLSEEKEHASTAHWEPHDLYFHFRSRIGRHQYPYGGTFHLKDQIPPSPCTKECLERPLMQLQKPEFKKQACFFDVLERRKSVRKHGEKPLSLEQLSEFLFFSSRIKGKMTAHGEELSLRPYPAGGARYELEINLIVHQCCGLERGVYHYHPLQHALCRVSEFNETAELLLKDACISTATDTFPQVLIILSARFHRVYRKYQSMAYAVILKNVGSLVQTMYLTASALDLAPCAIGGGNSDHFCQLVGTDYLEETSVGEFMLGSIPGTATEK
ncbi:MAG: SagB family peptide dehydrogenase [Verrucomicrobia bacterium]|nr:SagB family peptide dehydrogenase [Verrucomicrobiota bacterium]